MCKNLKWFSVVVLIILFSIMGCSSSESSNIDNIIESYYKMHYPAIKDKTQIFAQKEFEGGSLVLAEKYRGDGHSFTELFLLGEDKEILKVAHGRTPLSMCFTVNVIECGDSKILFGDFNNSKWLIEPDKKESVNIHSILVKFKNGEQYKEKVGKGYIIYSKKISDVEVVELYDEKGKLQSDLNDLQRYGEVFIETSFVNME